MTTPRLRAFWCRVPSRPNFGDALTPWLIRRLTGRSPAFAPLADPRPKMFVTGSVIAGARRGDVVWGSGVMSATEDVSPFTDVRAVRGPLTAARVRAAGGRCPDVHGDPALLLPLLLAASGRGGRIGLAPHFSDLPRVAPRWAGSAEVRLVDLQTSVEAVVAALTACEWVISSSLHAIIACHAYGIPATWVEFRPLPSGDRTKFHDHQLAVGLETTPPVLVGEEALDLDGLRRWAQRPDPFDTGPLRRSCPFWEAA